jgi:hypothetical protein
MGKSTYELWQEIQIVYDSATQSRKRPQRMWRMFPKAVDGIDRHTMDEDEANGLQTPDLIF